MPSKFISACRPSLSESMGLLTRDFSKELEGLQQRDDWDDNSAELMMNFLETSASVFSTLFSAPPAQTLPK